MRFIMAFILLGLIVAQPAYSGEFEVLYQSDTAKVVRDKSYGTSIGIFATKRGVVIIDPTVEDTDLPKLNDLIQNSFQSEKKYLLNTHRHSDHTGGNAFFQQQGFTLIDSLQGLKELGVIKHTQAVSHTANDNILYHPTSNILFTGDIYTTNWHPTFYAGGLTGFNKAVDLILSIGDQNTLIVPGHGKPTSKRELEQHRIQTFALVGRVKILNQAGKSVEQIKNDEEIKRLLAQFNLEGRQPFLPERALTRFIERTIGVLAYYPENHK
ncbi:MBL fold metallo-hydrolase [Pseudoalteromonas sp. Isolate6]|uniref:MBL fold metallo-hydrolase n=1 Tax=Pseudoalteromonas sp. Isolate6 TaxID=2908527 RepID=UPI001EFE62B3|nr:MBL fold metallo-hydrolase [Pseudoalteromonas sp. Isolate6]MCG9759230.1 MBL fold metallo-hydrolase [Pseudoalteromonas sp. Isolate6]